MRAIFRALLEDSGANGWVLRPRRPVDAPGGTHAQTLEAVHVLEASPLFARATPDQALRLAGIAREVPLAPGSTLFDEADPAALYVVASGAATVEPEGAPALQAGPGATLGVREALAGVSGGKARGEANGVALRLDGEALLEILAGDSALLQGVFGALLETRGSAAPRQG